MYISIELKLILVKYSVKLFNNKIHITFKKPLNNYKIWENMANIIRRMCTNSGSTISVCQEEKINYG